MGGLLDILRDDPLTFVLLAVSLLEAIALHEFAHALAADLQGDRLPRALGRLTLNPVKHLDPLGTILLFLAGFGWGKPVEFRREALSSKRFGAALVALAGPMMNLLLAFTASIPLSFICDEFDLSCSSRGVIPSFLMIFVFLNVVLAVFNLLPLPPLDGSRLLTIFLPPSKQNIIFFLDRYGILILLALLLFDVLPRIFNPLIDFALGVLLGLVGL